MEEKDLIRHLRWGEEIAFETIFRKYFIKLCLYAEHHVRNHKIAEEIVEDFFCHLWDNCQSLTISSSLIGYLFKGVHNRCLNYLRDLKVRQQYLAESKYFLTDDELLTATSSDAYNSEFITRELEENISIAINALPEQCRAVFCLNRFENLTYSEIAEKLGISINTVKTQMTRALRKLRDSLKEYHVILLFLPFVNNIL